MRFSYHVFGVVLAVFSVEDCLNEQHCVCAGSLGPGAGTHPLSWRLNGSGRADCLAPAEAGLPAGGSPGDGSHAFFLGQCIVVEYAQPLRFNRFI